jgi:cell division septum initiation protein DivIVA
MYTPKIMLIPDYIEEIERLKKENQELKKQVEERTKMYQNAYDYSQKIEGKAIILETQQKEFINYLEDMLDYENDLFSVVRVKDVLQKYKEIIGDDK